MINSNLSHCQHTRYNKLHQKADSPLQKLHVASIIEYPQGLTLLGQEAYGGWDSNVLPVTAPQDPVQHTNVLPKSRPQELTMLVQTEPVHMEDLWHLIEARQQSFSSPIRLLFVLLSLLNSSIK